MSRRNEIIIRAISDILADAELEIDVARAYNTLVNELQKFQQALREEIIDGTP